MSGFTVVLLAGSLVAVFLLMVAILVWQESKRGGFETGPVYVIDDAVIHIAERLDEPVFERLGVDGVRRVIEWEVRYLHEHRTGAVAGGDDRAIRFVVAGLAGVGGPTYAPDDVGAVLALEADYLREIGALGAPVDDGGQT